MRRSLLSHYRPPVYSRYCRRRPAYDVISNRKTADYDSLCHRRRAAAICHRLLLGRCHLPSDRKDNSSGMGAITRRWSYTAAIRNRADPPSIRILYENFSDSHPSPADSLSATVTRRRILSRLKAFCSIIN